MGDEGMGEEGMEETGDGEGAKEYSVEAVAVIGLMKNIPDRIAVERRTFFGFLLILLTKCKDPALLLSFVTSIAVSVGLSIICWSVELLCSTAFLDIVIILICDVFELIRRG